MEITSFTAAFTSLKLIGDAAKGMIGLKTDTEVRTAVYDIQEKLLSAQQEMFAVNAAQTVMVERIRDLEKQIANMEAWETQKQRYQMASPCAGSTVYALKKSMADGEPPHYLCANCYQQRKPSIMQNAQISSQIRYSGTTCFKCPVCKSETPTGYNGPVLAKYVEDMAEKKP
jgi:Zn finger protein HypA/HybF involved in hydrogenase expression